MKKPDRISLYTDIKQVLDAALASSGGSYVCVTHGAAVNWRQRCYKFRKAYFELFHDPKYDALTFPAIPPDSTTVVINRVKQPGLFVPNEIPASDLDDIAADIAKKLDGDIL